MSPKLSPKTITRLSVAGSLIGFGAFLVWLFAGLPAAKPPEVSKTKTAEEAVKGTNVTFTVTQQGHKQWRLLVSHVTYYPDRSGAHLVGVSGEFYNSKGEVVAHFTAPAGEYQNQYHRVVLQGEGSNTGVLVTSTDSPPIKIEAPQTEWSLKSNEVVAQGPVVIQTGDTGTAKADRCYFKLDMTQMRLEGQTEMTVAEN